MTLKTYQASCHCGAVRIELDLDLQAGTQRCNCSYCAKNRNWFAFVPAAQVHVVDGEAAQTEYQWTPPGRPNPFLHHNFCATCGSRTYAWGDHESMGGKFYAINLALLDDASIDELAAAPITYRDGRADRFEHEPADKRLM